MANNLQILDANAVIQTVSTTQAGGVHVPHQIIDSGVVSVSNFPLTQVVSGSVAVNNLPTQQAVAGNKTNNNAVPGASNIGVLPAVCNTSAPTYTDTFQVALSVDTNGNLRVIGGGGTQYADNATSGSTPTGTLSMGWDSSGSKVRALKVDASQNLLVNLSAGSNLVGKVEISDGTNVIGTTAHPVQTQDQSDGTTGATAPTEAGEQGLIAATSLPTAVTNGQLVGGMGDKYGRFVVLPQAPRDLVGTQTTQIVNSTSETTIVTAASSIYKDITGFQITNQSGTAVTVTIKDATSGTTRKVYDLAANGGIVVPFSPPLPQAVSNNNWTATLSVNTVTVDINVDYVNNS